MFFLSFLLKDEASTCIINLWAIGLVPADREFCRCSSSTCTWLRKVEKAGSSSDWLSWLLSDEYMPISSYEAELKLKEAQSAWVQYSAGNTHTIPMFHQDHRVEQVWKATRAARVEWELVESLRRVKHSWNQIMTLRTWRRFLCIRTVEVPGELQWHVPRIQPIKRQWRQRHKATWMIVEYLEYLGCPLIFNLCFQVCFTFELIGGLEA